MEMGGGGLPMKDSYAYDSDIRDMTLMVCCGL